MDKPCYTDILDIYYITNEELFKQQKTIIKNEILTTAYDDVITHQQPEHIQPDLVSENSVDNLNTYAVRKGTMIRCCKKDKLLNFIVILALLAGVVFLVFCYILNTSQDPPSTEKYPRLTPDLCDPVNPYHERSWFTSTLEDSLPCDVPIKIAQINVEVIIFSEMNRFNCFSKLECMSLIGYYYLGNIENIKYSFFVDCNSNELRGWLCPYMSGQLWVGVIMDCSETVDFKESKRILNHFENEIVDYAEKCGFISSSVVRNLNTSYA